MKRLLFRLGAILILVVVAIVCFIVGRGHTVYFDNVAVEYDGTTYEAYDRVSVYVKGERVARLSEDDRGSTDTVMGQRFSMILEIRKEKDGEITTSSVSMSLPYHMDGVVVNVPALMNGLPEDVWLSEFVPAVPETTDEDEEINIDEFEMQDL